MESGFRWVVRPEYQAGFVAETNGDPRACKAKDRQNSRAGHKPQLPRAAAKRAQSLAAPWLVALRTPAQVVTGVASRFTPMR